MITKYFKKLQEAFNIWIIAGPLVVLGFGLILTRGVLELVWNNDPWYLVIAIFGLCLLAMALWPVRTFIRQWLKD